MLEFRNISIQIKNKKILDNFSLTIPEGAIMGLIGSDGEARNQLLEIAGGGKKPSSGEIILNGVSMGGGKNYIYSHVGYMPKQYGFHELLRVDEMFELFLSLYHINGRYRQRRIEEVLELISMKEYASAFIQEIPAEQLPFLCLGKTILHDPEWLFLNEPFLNLNSVDRSRMLKILLILQEQGKSIVVNSQIFPELPDIFSDIVVIEDGKALASGTVQEVYERALRQSPVRMRVLDGMENALQVLKHNRLVDRVTVDGREVIFHFNGTEKDEAELLSSLVLEGALIQSYMRDRINLEKFWRR